MGSRHKNFGPNLIWDELCTLLVSEFAMNLNDC